MADPEVDHEFVYNEEGFIDLLRSPFFDFNPEVDDFVEEYVERILFTLADFIKEFMAFSVPARMNLLKHAASKDLLI
ncbi:hypothetical protein M5K25_020373 [Dendrobium thyrsiflorum]|uniref:Uncharacterized protein n=1 Tax=Dendrobium thyrsiflorum TaxID=117978 RepID=A0ABD0U9Q1_DENTH